MRRIYLDHNATTPLCDEAREAMLPYLSDRFGNPSSLHWAGQEARKAIDDARSKVAQILGAKAGEVYFTSGGTESASLAIGGILKGRKGHVVALPVEHHSVLEPLKDLESSGLIEVTWIPVDSVGQFDPEEIRRAIRPETSLIAAMFANNETGNIYPVAAVGKIAREHQIPFFCDGVQTVGRLPIDLKLLPIDLLSFSAHKFYGPKGVGGLYVREGIQQRPLRGGTENVSGIIGLAVALERSYRVCDQEGSREKLLRNRLEEGALDIPGSRIHGDPHHRLPNTSNLGFEGIDSEIILVKLDQAGIAASNGAACASGTLEPSHVLMAQGLSLREARGAVRFSLGRGTTKEEIDEVLRVLPKIAETLRCRS